MVHNLRVTNTKHLKIITKKELNMILIKYLDEFSNDEIFLSLEDISSIVIKIESELKSVFIDTLGNLVYELTFINAVSAQNVYDFLYNKFIEYKNSIYNMSSLLNEKNIENA